MWNFRTEDNMDDQLSNGHDLSEEEENAARDIRRIQAREPVPVIEATPPAPPFQQQAHTLMLESVDRLAEQWITELSAVRNNTMVVEQMVLQTCAKTKDELTRLHLLGHQVMSEARRGEEVCSHLEEQLERLMQERAAP
jgi:hypothetical protein